MSSLGDFDASTVVYGKFTTYRPSTGAPFTLGGTPALSVYKDNSTTQSTTGVTLTADFDTVTGLNHFAIDTSADGTFYAAGSFFDVVITTGTVDSISAVGSVVARFTLRKTSALKPATAGRTLAVDAAGLADANAVKLGPTGSGTAQTARDIGASVLLSSGTGTGQLDFTSGVVKGNVTQLLGTAWLTPGTAGTPDVNVRLISGDATAADNAEAFFDGTGYAGTGNVIPTVTNTATLASRTAAQLVDDVWDEVLTGGTHNIASSAGRRLRQLDASSIISGTAAAGATNSITLDGSASATDDIYDENLIVITGGTGAGQTRVIVEYNGTTKVAIVNRVWQTTPDATSTYDIIAAAQADIVQHGLAQGGTASTITLPAAASATDDIYVGSQVYISTSTGAGQTRLITAYNGTTKVATVSPNWVTNPTSASVYKILPVGRSIVDSGTVTTLTNLPAITANWLTAAGLAADAVTEIKAAIVTNTLTVSAGGVADANAVQLLGTAWVAPAVAGTPDVNVGWWATTGVATTRVYTSGNSIELPAVGLHTRAQTQIWAETTRTLTAADNLTALASQASVNTIDDFLDTEIAAIKAKTDLIPAAPAAVGDIPTVSQIWSTALTEAYRGAGAAGTAAQMLYELIAHMGESSITSTTKTLKKLDGTTAAKTYTLNSASAPTSITEAT